MSLSHEPLDPLTPREQEILRLLVRGFSDQEIALELVLTLSTVKWYNREIYSKLGVNKRSQAVMQAQRLGLAGATPTISATQPDRVHNLPAEVTSFIGRERELAELKGLLRRARIVTLAGAPGTGKTRLALRAAREMISSFRDGVFFVSLAPVQDPDLVLNIIAKALGVEEKGGRPLLELVKRHLADRQVLLVLDNFEHLLEAAVLVGELVAAAPELSTLITSREALNLYGEQEYPVPPLATPNLQAPMDLEHLRANDAVQLFVQRAQAALPTFTLSEENAASVAAICAHLEGLPLAVELAAGRARLYPPQSLLLRLASRLEVLTEGPRDLPARQRTLRSTLAWSYGLLEPPEQLVFARLGVFNGGCTLEAAQVVCHQGLDGEVPDKLASLVNKNLLRPDTGRDGEPHFLMLETLREYALEQLRERGEAEAVGRRHAEYFATLAERLSAQLYGRSQLQGLSMVDAEYDNLRVALRWSLERNDGAEIAFRLAAGLARYWLMRSQFGEGRSWLNEVLATHGVPEDSRVYADVVYGLADLAYYQSDYETTQQYFGQALTLYRNLGERWRVAQVLMGLGNVATEIGDYETAPALFEEAYEIMRELDDAFGSARALALLGWCALRPGDYEGAKARLEAALELYEEIGDVDGIALTLSGLGEIALRQGESESAHDLLEQSLTLRRGLGDLWGIAISLGSLGWAALQADHRERAGSLLMESLVIRHQIGDTGGAAWCLEKLGELRVLQHHDLEAARLLGAAAALREGVNSVIDPADLPHSQQLTDTLRDRMGPGEYDHVWSEGQRMSMGRVLEWLKAFDRP